MRVYAKCVYGQQEAARLRIEAALGLPPTADPTPPADDDESPAATADDAA
jgi:hypothetical protein